MGAAEEGRTATAADGGDAPGVREELATALSHASHAALERASAYLYASYSLKAHPDEDGGLAAQQATLVRGWKRRLAAAGAWQLATWARATRLRAALGGDGRAVPGPVVVEPFSDHLLDRLAGLPVATEDAEGPARPQSGLAIGAAAAALSVDVPTVPALDPWLPEADDPQPDPAAGLDEIRAELRTAAAEAERDGAPFDPVRPVVANPALEDRSPGQTVITDELTRAVGELFNGAWRATLWTLAQSTSIDGPEPGNASVQIARTLLSSVVRPLGEALTRLPVGAANGAGVGAGATFVDLRASDPEPPVPPAELLWRLALDATRLSVRPGLPAEVLEATAALQELACGSAPAGVAPDGVPGRAAMVAELRTIQATRWTGIQAVANGPYLVTNVDDIQTALGEPIGTAPSVALCRCGQSQRKPFCDGTHARVEFTDRKDPKRVPDRHDTYQGVQATTFDNRGICAHSGFCTDRLPTVFRASEEPFVAPSGGRLDEIVGAARACPSGALSHGIEGREAREQVDQDRPPKIEVSQDGPYRITGGIPLIDAHGDDEPRNAGASREHYSLCRCGQSQNKPFCSGMHWYVDFHDPSPPAEPNLFQWAGGLPALLRMTRVFYGKYVPEDPLLAPLFANMSPDHPERVATWLGEVFGGPTYYTERYGGYPRMVSEHIGKGITEAHRTRWVSLLGQAADDARLPGDPEFRAAFVAYLEWGSRLAVENSTVGAHPPAGMPVPKWWWVCDATPSARVSAFAHLEEEAEPAVALPADGEPLRFEQHIKSLFRDRDRQSMRFVFDLWSYDDVRAHGADILARVRNGTMPCDGAWPEDRVRVFERWVDAGMPA